MLRTLLIPFILALIVALPFTLRRPPEAGNWSEGDPFIVIVTPHTESIRYEFERGFSEWHEQRFGRPVKIEWRVVGGTSEIIRYLTAEYAQATKAWWTSKGRLWPAGASDAVTNSRFPTDRAPRDVPFDLWSRQLEIHAALRATDDPRAINIRMDLFFGGGEFDHSEAFRRGLTVPPWPEGQEPPDIINSFPARLSGETWRTPTLIGTALSTFGIACNFDRLRDLGISNPPTTWPDLADPVYFLQLALADPTKSGSAAKAFENIIHQQVYQSVRRAGFSDDDIDRFEKLIAGHAEQLGGKYQRGDVPADVPSAYQQAVEKGWEEGLFLVQAIGANARYFTDSASKVPIDVAVGDAAVGMLIDFYGRAQSEISRVPGRDPRMTFITPVGGSSVSCDPVSLLRGAGDPTEAAADPAQNRRRQVAIRFIEFVLSEEGQKLWCYRVGTPGGPHQYALRRLPIRRDFYPSTQPAIHARHQQHLIYAADNLADPGVNPYHLAGQFIYQRRWTSSHFNIQRDLIRAMCIDSAQELRRAWDPLRSPNRDALNAELRQLPTVTLRDPATGRDEPVPLNWRSAPDIPRRYDRLEYMRKWTQAFRAQYRRAAGITR